VRVPAALSPSSLGPGEVARGRDDDAGAVVRGAFDRLEQARGRGREGLAERADGRDGAQRARRGRGSLAAWPAATSRRRSAAESSSMMSSAAARAARAMASGSSSAVRLVMWRSIRWAADSAGRSAERVDAVAEVVGGGAEALEVAGLQRRVRAHVEDADDAAIRAHGHAGLGDDPIGRRGVVARRDVGGRPSSTPEVNVRADDARPWARCRPARASPPVLATQRKRPPRSSHTLGRRPRLAARWSATV
jgi:hypothetical protein